MKANELRIGNYVNWIDGKIQEITGKDIHWKEKNDNTELSPFDFAPIPLTEEWLLKFGFRESNKYLFKYKLGLKKRGDNYFYDNISIKHVHQLQNLYFALTGEELTLKQ